MNEQFVRVAGIDLCYDTVGEADGEPLLLIMGLGSGMHWWDDAFCELLAERGFYVVRFDNRDVGRSSRITTSPRPRPVNAILGDRRSAGYTLGDMARDAVGLLDGLGIDAAHVAGVSMGGMIGQTMAIRHPDRVRSLTSIMSSTGGRWVGRPTLGALSALFTRRPTETREGFVEASVPIWRRIGSPPPLFDEDRVRRMAGVSYDRGVDPVATARQLVGVLASRDRTASLRDVRLPALVIHGAEDPLIDVSGGRATAKAIPDSEFLVVPGMGHDLPAPLWSTFVDGIERTARRA